MSVLQAEKKAPLRTKGNSPIVARRDSRSSPAPHLIKEFLVLGHAVRFRAKGTSMIPTIRDGEFITVCPVKPSDIRLHDIILYQSNTSLTAHRVIRQQRATPNVVFITRGDASGSCDSPVESDQVFGKVICVDRNGRSIRLDSRRSRGLYSVRVAVLFVKRKMYRGAKAMRFVNTGKP